MTTYAPPKPKTKQLADIWKVHCHSGEINASTDTEGLANAVIQLVHSTAHLRTERRITGRDVAAFFETKGITHDMTFHSSKKLKLYEPLIDMLETQFTGAEGQQRHLEELAK